MRRTTFTARTVAIGPTISESVPFNKKRVALTISGVVAAIASFAHGNDGTDRLAYVTSLAHGPIKLTIQADGAAVFGPFWGSAAGGQTVTVAETFLEEE